MKSGPWSAMSPWGHNSQIYFTIKAQLNPADFLNKDKKKLTSLTALLKSVHPRYICWAVILFICKTLQGAFEIMMIIKKSLSLFLPHRGADWLFRWCPLPVKSWCDGKNICVFSFGISDLLLLWLTVFFFFFLMSQSPCTSLSSVTNGLQG